MREGGREGGVGILINEVTRTHLDGVLANTERIPQFDGVVTGTGHNLSVVGREGDTEHILGVTDKPSRGFTPVEK